MTNEGEGIEGSTPALVGSLGFRMREAGKDSLFLVSVAKEGRRIYAGRWRSKEISRRFWSIGAESLEADKILPFGTGIGGRETRDGWYRPTPTHRGF